jgi:DNA-binding FadR family transcriptional regulator
MSSASCRNALQLLEIEGLTLAGHGRGVFVPTGRRRAGRHRTNSPAATATKGKRRSTRNLGKVTAQASAGMISAGEIPALPDS